MPFKPNDKLKSVVTLEDMFRKQKLKQNASVVVKEEQAEDIVVGLQDLAEAMGE